MAGIPYAEANIDGAGRYYVTCPICDTPCYGQAFGGEDTVTKTANRTYADHYEAEHTEPEERTVTVVLSFYADDIPEGVNAAAWVERHLLDALRDSNRVEPCRMDAHDCNMLQEG